MAFAATEYETAFDQFVRDAMRELAGAHEPLLAEMDVERSPGATASVIQDRRGEDVDLGQEAISAEVTIRRAPIRRGSLVDLWLLIDDLARQFAEGMVEGLIRGMGTITSATGNVVDAKGSLTFDVFLQALDKIAWSLDEDGNLSMPTLVVNPETAKKLPSDLTPEQQAQLEQLQERKLRELVSRQRSRRLP